MDGNGWNKIRLSINNKLLILAGWATATTMSSGRVTVKEEQEQAEEEKKSFFFIFILFYSFLAQSNGVLFPIYIYFFALGTYAMHDMTASTRNHFSIDTTAPRNRDMRDSAYPI